LVEKSLSVDNLFVFMAIFAAFGIVGTKEVYQHRVLYFGILGALVMRFLFIGVGTSLMLVGQWVLALFGIIVLWSAWQMYQQMGQDADEIEDYSNHWSVRVVRRILPVHPRLAGHNFFTRQDAKLCVTPLLLCLVCLEVSDVLFAFDSVPAVIAITQKPFLIYTSNIFAILGLRSMYFFLSAAKRHLSHLEGWIIVILCFIGLKLFAGVFEFHIPTDWSLYFIMGCLGMGVLHSVLFPAPKEEADKVA